MCLMLYLGVSKPMTPFRTKTEDHQVFLRRASRKGLPARVTEKAHCYLVADYECSCIFLSGGGEPDKFTLMARDRLTEIVAAARKLDDQALLFAQWLGDAPDSDPVDRQVTPQDFVTAEVWEGITAAPVFFHFGKRKSATQ